MPITATVVRLPVPANDTVSLPELFDRLGRNNTGSDGYESVRIAVVRERTEISLEMFRRR